jgi:hypothetical protein
MRSRHLRIKIKSLAAEAAMIRLEERRVSKSRHWLRDHQGDGREVELSVAEQAALHRHRTVDVRCEARAGLLAYAFLRGKPYGGFVEPAGSSMPKALPGHVASLVARFGALPSTTAEREVKSWIAADPGAAAPTTPA